MAALRCLDRCSGSSRSARSSRNSVLLAGVPRSAIEVAGGAVGADRSWRLRLSNVKRSFPLLMAPACGVKHARGKEHARAIRQSDMRRRYQGLSYIPRALDTWAAVRRSSTGPGNRASKLRKIRQLGGVEEGVRHIKTYGTAWGGYALEDVDDSEAFARYQAHHNQNYGHMARDTSNRYST